MGVIIGDLLKWSLLYSIPFVGECCGGNRRNKALWNNLLEKCCAFPKDPEGVALAERAIKTHNMARVIGNVVKIVQIIALAFFTSPWVLLFGLKFVCQAGNVLLDPVSKNLGVYKELRDNVTDKDCGETFLQTWRNAEAIKERKEAAERAERRREARGNDRAQAANLCIEWNI